jgi:hypothetical protein
VLPGETLYDFFASAVKSTLTWWVPFFLGRAMIRTREELIDLFRVIAVLALVYSVFIWIEVRMSPQMNAWVYGFHAGDFIQTMRFGGYRPTVFMRHGLNVALFVVVSLVAMGTLKRLGQRFGRAPAGRWLWYMVAVLIVCKSSGAYVYAGIFVVAATWGGVRLQMMVATSFAAIEIFYPLLRLAGWIPVDDIVRFFSEKLDDDRAMSLWFRFQTEEQLLVRATERFAFGWGGFGRWMIFDPVTGQTQTIVDGFWARTIGFQGLVGFMAIFGMLLLPVRQAKRAFGKLKDKTDRQLLTGLSLMVAVYVLDLLPNASVHGYLTFLAGVLAGAPSMLLGPRQQPELLANARPMRNR